MAFVSVTRLRIRALRFVPAFALLTGRTRAQVRAADGFLDGALLADHRWTFWTLTAWRDAAAMRAYMTTGAHQAAMPKLLHWCDEASVAHWEGPPTLDWEDADRRMRTTGRPSKLHHPSAAHAMLAYDPPAIARSVRIVPRRP